MTDDEIRARAQQIAARACSGAFGEGQIEYEIADLAADVARETREQCAREAGTVVGEGNAMTHYDRFSSTDSHCHVCGSPIVEQDGEHFTNGARNRVRGCKNVGCSSRMLDPTNEACLRQGHDWSWGFLGGYDRCRRCGRLYGGI